MKKPGDSNWNWPEIERLYYLVLKHFYGSPHRIKDALRYARSLKTLLETTPESQEAILGQNALALLAELQDDLPAAIKHRETVVEMLRRLLEGSDRMKDLDWSDVTDQLTLIALLYDRSGDTNRALRILAESRKLCLRHHIQFDDDDLIQELQESPRVDENKESRRRG